MMSQVVEYGTVIVLFFSLLAAAWLFFSMLDDRG